MERKCENDALPLLISIYMTSALHHSLPELTNQVLISEVADGRQTDEQRLRERVSGLVYGVEPGLTMYFQVCLTEAACVSSSARLRA